MYYPLQASDARASPNHVWHVSIDPKQLHYCRRNAGHLAVIAGDPQWLRLALASMPQSDIDASDVLGRTPAMYAKLLGDDEALHLLNTARLERSGRAGENLAIGLGGDSTAKSDTNQLNPSRSVEQKSAPWLNSFPLHQRSDGSSDAPMLDAQQAPRLPKRHAGTSQSTADAASPYLSTEQSSYI